MLPVTRQALSERRSWASRMSPNTTSPNIDREVAEIRIAKAFDIIIQEVLKKRRRKQNRAFPCDERI